MASHAGVHLSYNGSARTSPFAAHHSTVDTFAWIPPPTPTYTSPQSYSANTLRLVIAGRPSSAHSKTRIPTLLLHCARGLLPHLRFPHSGTEDGERAPMRQARRRGGHACRNVVRVTGAKGAMGVIGLSLIQYSNLALHGPEWPPRRPHASNSAHLRPRSRCCIRGAGTTTSVIGQQTATDLTAYFPPLTTDALPSPIATTSPPPAHANRVLSAMLTALPQHTAKAQCTCAYVCQRACRGVRRYTPGRRGPTYEVATLCLWSLLMLEMLALTCGCRRT